MLPATEIPEEMVFVPDGEYALIRSRQIRVPLDDFFIDAYEVSNEQYRAFVLAGPRTA